MLLRLQRIQSKGIVEAYRAVACIWIKICAFIEPQRVFAEEAPGALVVVSGAIVIQARFGVELAPRVLKWISQRAGGIGLFAKGIERAGLYERTGAAAQRRELHGFVGCAHSVVEMEL